MKILLIDNYDSFVFNIVGLLRQCRREFPCLEWDVVKNDRVTLPEAEGYDGLILSPGPGLPAEAGRMPEVIKRCAGRIPILGVCLGCQAIAEAFGCGLRQLEAPRHGHPSPLHIEDPSDPLVGFLSGQRVTVGRYHSWVIDESTMTADTPLTVTSRDEDGLIMSISHRTHPLFGLQFHPESIITTHGPHLLLRFLRLTAGSGRRKGV